MTMNVPHSGAQLQRSSVVSNTAAPKSRSRGVDYDITGTTCPCTSTSTVTSKTSKTALSSPSASAASIRHGQSIRNRYLQVLGISRNSASSLPVAKTLKTSIIRESSERQTSNSGSRSPGTLLCHNDTITTTSSSLSSTSSLCSSSTNATTTKEKVVRFVTATPSSMRFIPNRHSYSPHRKQLLWISPRELHENYHRNVVEFQSENWDYRQAIEEDQFVVTMPRGELVHPIHVLNSAQQFCLQQRQQHRSTAGAACGACPSPPHHHHRRHHHHHCRSSSSSSSSSSSRTTTNNSHSDPIVMQRGCDDVGHHLNLKNHFCRVMVAQQYR